MRRENNEEGLLKGRTKRTEGRLVHWAGTNKHIGSGPSNRGSDESNKEAEMIIESKRTKGIIYLGASRNKGV